MEVEQVESEGPGLTVVPRVPRGSNARTLMLPGNLDFLFRRRPDLIGTKAAKIAESIRDAVVMNV